MIQFVKEYSNNVYSQNGEDGIIEEILSRLKYVGGLCCEFGAADGYWCSNTRKLIDEGWKCIMLEASKGQFVTPENVNELVPDVDVLSIDVDGNDYNIWAAYDKKPAIVVIEINSSIQPGKDSPVSDLENGTGYKPMVELGIKKGYFLLCHTGNLIFVDKKFKRLFPEIKGDGLQNTDEYFNRQWLRF